MIPAVKIKNLVSIENLLSRLGLEPNRAGFINCPAHADEDPSLKIYPDTNSFYCYSCLKGGTVIDFYMLYANCDFKTANQTLAAMYGLTNEVTRADRRMLLRQRIKPRKESELQYWTRKYDQYQKVLKTKHEDWNPELEEACQNIAYAEHRMEVAYDKRRLEKYRNSL